MEKWKCREGVKRQSEGKPAIENGKNVSANRILTTKVLELTQGYYTSPNQGVGLTFRVTYLWKL